MKRLALLLLAATLTPLAAAQHDVEALVAHGERKKAAYLVLRLITQEMELIPTESLDQCEMIGNEIMQGGKLSKFLTDIDVFPACSKQIVNRSPLKDGLSTPKQQHGTVIVGWIALESYSNSNS